jgi:hypothetical protein
MAPSAAANAFAEDSNRAVTNAVLFGAPFSRTVFPPGIAGRNV